MRKEKKAPQTPSLWETSMIHMTFPQIEKAAEENDKVLLPITVLEEYGPHLPIGTNLFLTCRVCRKVKELLTTESHGILLGAPLYWGRNHSTGSFHGSFHLRKETLTALLGDILEDFQRWGFRKVFLFGLHGDAQHTGTVLQVLKKINSKGISCRFLLPESSLGQYQLKGSEAFISPYPLPLYSSSSLYLDLHAGSLETSWMAAVFPQWTNAELAKTLGNTKTTTFELPAWAEGWEKCRQEFPQGYCGDPAAIDTKKALAFEESLVNELCAAIRRSF